MTRPASATSPARTVASALASVSSASAARTSRAAIGRSEAIASMRASNSGRSIRRSVRSRVITLLPPGLDRISDEPAQPQVPQAREHLPPYQVPGEFRHPDEAQRQLPATVLPDVLAHHLGAAVHNRG